MPVVPKLAGRWAKFATSSVPAGRTVLCIEKNKTQNTRITLDTFVHCIFFLCLVTCWQCATASFVDDSCNIWFHACCCYTLIAPTIFEELCIPHQSQQRRSRDLNFETETSSKSPRLENLQIMPKCFCKFSKKCHHHFEVEIFANFWHFSYLLVLFLTCRYKKTKSTLN